MKEDTMFSLIIGGWLCALFLIAVLGTALHYRVVPTGMTTYPHCDSHRGVFLPCDPHILIAT